jgi:hypothetical protein
MGLKGGLFMYEAAAVIIKTCRSSGAIDADM